MRERMARKQRSNIAAYVADAGVNEQIRDIRCHAQIKSGAGEWYKMLQASMPLGNDILAATTNGADSEPCQAGSKDIITCDSRLHGQRYQDTRTSINQ